jgi:hypothetical protein
MRTKLNQGNNTERPQAQCYTHTYIYQTTLHLKILRFIPIFFIYMFRLILTVNNDYLSKCLNQFVFNWRRNSSFVKYDPNIGTKFR